VTLAPARSSPRHAERNRPLAAPLPRRADLEGLRAIAVLGVVVYHLRPSWLPGGFAGVDVFFVLSGFLITGLLLREGESSASVDLLAFWGRRARRLLPAAAVVATTSIVAGLVFVDALDARRFAIDGIYAALFSVNWHYAALGTSYLSDPDPSPLTHYWSLGLEEQFYVLWPLAILALVALGARFGRTLRPRVTIGVVATGVVGVSFVVALKLTHTDQPYAYFATYARAWQLALGAVLAGLANFVGRVPRGFSSLARWSGVAVIIGFFVLAPADILYPGWFALLPACGAAAIIAAGVPRREGSAGGHRDPIFALLVSAPAQWLGRYSYGWYLWHWPPLVLVPLAIGHGLSVRELIACALLSLLGAVLSYHVLEHPVRSSRVLAARRGRWSLALGGTIVAVAVAAAGVVDLMATHRIDTTQITTSRGILLSPQPGVAAAEQPRPQRDGCEVAITSRTMSPECRYLPDEGHGDVVLVGDSHAVQWFPAVFDVARARGWGLRVWTRQSCPLAQVSKPINEALGACNAWRDNVMLRLVAAPPSLVIVAGDSSVAPNLLDPKTGAMLTGAAAAAAYEAGLQLEVSALRRAGSRVLLIQDNPTLDQSGPKCVLANPHHLSRCATPRKTAIQTTIDQDVAAAVPGVELMDLTPQLCDPARCSPVVGSILAYRDTNHLTSEFVRSQEPELARAAASALTG
jgi:peptidoglycan/LPS O-acetylase OafA/YrhL